MSGLFSTPSAPQVVKPPVMPTANDQQIQDARRRAAASAMALSGRQSTVLSQAGQSDKLGS